MTRFTYFYRTSDGVRRQGEMSAASRDEAFAVLRRQGIRPIKMLSDEKPARGIRRRWAIGIAIACTLLSALVSYRLAQPPDDRKLDGGYSPAHRADMERLVEKARALGERHKADMTLLDLADLADYAKISAAPGMDAFTNRIARARALIASSRADAKELFADVCVLFPPEAAAERHDAQKLYGEMMRGIDISEERLNCDELVAGLLFAHRGEWGVRDGKLAFSDGALSRKVEFFLSVRP